MEGKENWDSSTQKAINTCGIGGDSRRALRAHDAPTTSDEKRPGAGFTNLGR